MCAVVARNRRVEKDKESELLVLEVMEAEKWYLLLYNLLILCCVFYSTDVALIVS